MNEAKSDFTRGSIIGKLIPFMMPVLGSLVLQMMYGAVDVIIIGHFGSTAGLSGVSTGSSVLNLVTLVVTWLSMGVTVLIGRYLGEANREKIGPLLGGTAVLFSLISALLFVVMFFSARHIAVIMRSPPEAEGLTALYIRICGLGIFFIVAYNVVSAVFRGLGDSRTPMLLVAFACCVNVILDLALVAGFRMDVAGAALATVAAQAASVLLAALLVRRRGLPFAVRRCDLRLGQDACDIIKVGLPLTLQELLTQLSFLVLVAFINVLGLEASSGYGVASKVIGFIMLTPSAITQAMSSFVSQNVGAGLEERARQTIHVGMSAGVAIGLMVFYAVFFHGDLISGLFTDDAVVIAKSFEYLRGYASEAVLTAICFSFVGYFNGHQQTLFVMLQGIGQILVRLPFAYYMSTRPNASLTYVAMAASAATSFGIIVNWLYFLYFNRALSRKRGTKGE